MRLDHKTVFDDDPKPKVVNAKEVVSEETPKAAEPPKQKEKPDSAG
jgi:hypothetical protein